MKYIDADKLKAEIERRLERYDPNYTSAGSELKELLSFVTSLQQEQSEMSSNMIKDDTLRDNVIEYLVNKGYPVSTSGEIPTYEETFDIVKNLIEYINNQEHPEVDLEKEIDKTVSECTNGYNFDWDKFARHFYELGRNAKKQ